MGSWRNAMSIVGDHAITAVWFALALHAAHQYAGCALDTGVERAAPRVRFAERLRTLADEPQVEHGA